MDRPYVEKLHIQGFGCIQDAEIHLTPLHALIGPNDSGKSTALQALHLLATLGSGSVSTVAESTSVQDLVRSRRSGALLRLTVARGEASWAVAVTGPGPSSALSWGIPGAEETLMDVTRPVGLPPILKSALGCPFFFQPDPAHMRQATSLIPDYAALTFQSSGGLGLPAVYDAIKDRNIEAFLEINKRFQSMFPTVKSLSTRNPSNATKAIGVTLKNGTFVPAEHMSEGMLYFLAFAALRYLDPVSILLVEEPENGLHPARIAEVMRILREISKTTQVLMATHSPLVINELEGDEVTVLTRTPEQGTKARLLKDSFNYAERSRIYQNGELWLAHCNGEDEKDLFQAPEAAE